MKEPIKLRPHHLKRFYDINYDMFTDHSYIRNFFNLILKHHYSPKFAFNYFRLAKKLSKNPDLKVQIVPSLDDVCKLCRPINPSCLENEEIPEGLKVKYGKTYTAKELMKIADECWNDFD